MRLIYLQLSLVWAFLLIVQLSALASDSDKPFSKDKETDKPVRNDRPRKVEGLPNPAKTKRKATGVVMNSNSSPKSEAIKLSAIPLKNIEIKPLPNAIEKIVGPDPFAFSISSNKDSVSLGEEFELTIKVNWVDFGVNNGVKFLPEWYKYSLKLAMPKGFRQTGGDYSDYCTKPVDAQNTEAVFTVKGMFEYSSEENVFKVLRGFEGAGDVSEFIFKTAKSIEIKKQSNKNKSLRIASGCIYNSTTYTLDNVTYKFNGVSIPLGGTYYTNLNPINLDITFNERIKENGVFGLASIFINTPAGYNVNNPDPYAQYVTTIPSTISFLNLSTFSGVFYPQFKVGAVCVVRTDTFNLVNQKCSGVIGAALGSITASANSPIDAGQTLNLISQYKNPSGVVSLLPTGATLSWSKDGITVPSTTITNVSVADTGNYVVKVAIGANCQVSSTVNVSLVCAVPPVPLIRMGLATYGYITDSLHIASGQRVVLQNNNYCPGILKWSNGATGYQIDVFPTMTTTYTAYCQDGNCRSANSSSVKIIVTNNCSKITIGTPYLYTSNNKLINPGDTLTLGLQDICTNYNSVTKWTDGTTIFPAGSKVTPTQNKNYLVRCENSGCFSVYDTLRVFVKCGNVAPLTVSYFNGGNSDFPIHYAQATGCSGTISWFKGSQSNIRYLGQGNKILLTDVPGYFLSNAPDYAICSSNGCSSNISNNFNRSTIPFDPSIDYPQTLNANIAGKVGAVINFACGESAIINVNGCRTDKPKQIYVFTFDNYEFINLGKVSTYPFEGNSVEIPIPANPNTNTTKSYLYLECYATNKIKPTWIGIGNSVYSNKNTPYKVAINTTNGTICTGGSSQLYAQNCGGTVQWQSRATAGVWANTISGDTISVSPTVNTFYRAKCTTANCPSNPWSDSLSVNINSGLNAPNAPVIVGDTIIYYSLDDPFNSTGAAIRASCNGSIVWSTGQQGDLVYVRPSVTTSYTARCSGNGCLSQPSKPVVVNICNILAPIVTLSKDTIYWCGNRTVTLKVKGCASGIYAGYYYDENNNLLYGGSIDTVNTLYMTGLTKIRARCMPTGGVGCPSKLSDYKILNFVGPVTPTVKSNGKNQTLGNASRSGSADFCDGQPIILNVDNCPGIVKWYADGSNGLQFTGSTGNTYTVPNLVFAPGEILKYKYYDASCTINNCESSTGSFLVQSHKIPTPSISTTSPSQICSGANVALSIAGCSNGITLWNGVNGGTNMNVNPVRDTTFTAKCRLDYYGCESPNSNTLSFNIIPTPTQLTISPTTITVCPSDSATLTASACVGYVSWSNGKNGQVIKVAPATTSTFTATCVNSCGVSGANSSPTTVTVQPLPKPVVSASETLLCTNGLHSNPSVTLTATGCGANTVQWSNSMSGASITFTPTVSKKYSAVCVRNTCISAPADSIQLTVLSVPLPPSVAVSNRYKCVGIVRNDNVFAQGYNGGLKWYANGVLLTDTTNVITVSPTVTTKYYTTSTNYCGTSNASPMDSIVLVPIPNITSIALLNKSVPNVCTNNPTDKLQLQANGCTGTVEWTGGELTGQNITGTTVLVKPTALTTYSARCNDRGCLSVYRNFQGSIFVERPLTMTVVNSPIAVGQSSRLKATYGYAQYRWFTTTNLTTPFATTTDSSIVVRPTVNTAYFVKCDGYCVELSTQPTPQSVLIDIPPTPTITAATNSICEGSNASVQLTVSGCTTGSVMWDNGETGLTRIVTPLFTTTYSACCISSYGNMGATKGYTTITVTALPTIKAYPVTAKVGELIKLAVDVTPTGTYTYNWTGPSAFTSTQQNPQVIASAVKLTHQGIYTIRIGGASVCTAIATMKVTIQDAQCGCDDCATLVTTDPFNNPTVAITGKNYVVENSYLSPQTTIPTTAVAMMQTISYLDGLGRPIQKTAVKAGTNQEDLISTMEYDVFGREATKRLPFAVPANNGGKLIVNPVDYIKDYYSKDVAKQTDKDFAFAQTVFEASPLNRVLQQGSPGQVWQPTANANDALNHTMRMSYLVNTKAGTGMDVESKLKDNIKLFTFPSITTTTVEAQTVVVGVYEANQLMVNISTDENGNKMAECKDKEGRVVCKRVQNANQVGILEIAETNYAYDDFGLLRFVFQPKAASALIASATAITPLSAASTINELVFGYNYDNRFRPIEKKVPGMAKTEMVYDKRDRLVYSLDGWGRNVTATTGRSNGVYARYDELNRVIESGYYKVLANTNCGTPAVNSSTNPRGYLQCSFDLATAPAYDFLATAAVADKVVLLNNVYDAYPTGDEAKFNLTHAYSQAKTSNVKGLLVKTIDKVIQNNVVAVVANILNPSVTTLMYYDNLGRVIQSNTVNHSNGTDIASTQLDFAGRVTASLSTTNYTWRPSSGATTALTPIVIENKTTYDFGGRVASVCQKNDVDTWEPVVRNSYSKIGELLGKKMGCDIQNVDYQYNIRSWLTKINDPANLGANNRDLFGLNLTYNDATQFNGNITKLEWNTLSKLDGVVVPKGLQQYTYTYDKMNRLQTANFSSSVTTLNAIGISVAMGNGTDSYDLNGNILFMKRTVNAALVDNLTYTYDKSGLSNRLLKIADAGDKTNANYFVDGTNTTNDYTYDANGNMIADANKSINSIVYNHANLPTLISNNSTVVNGGKMKYYYTFTGKKVRTEVIDGASGTMFTNAKTIEYVNGLAFKGGALEFVPTAAGRALTAKYVWSNSTTTITPPAPPVAPANQYRYEYQLQDHLGNLRVSCRCGDPKRNGSGDIIAGLEPTMAVQENHYDPWGLGFADAASSQKPLKNTDRFQYNGKEKVGDLGLNLMDYGARHYDATIGRFISVDPKAEEMRRWSTYNYAFDNPLRFIDPDGMAAKDVYIIGDDEKANNKAFEQLKASTSLTLSRDDKTGKVSATGEAKTDADKKLQAAVSDKDVNVIIETTDDSQVIGVFDGNEKKDGKINTFQYVNPENTAKVDGFTERPSGNTILHEVLESYIGGLNTSKTGITAKSTDELPSEQNQAYKDAHNEANKIDLRHKDNYDGYNTKGGTMLQRNDNPSKTMLLPYPNKKK